MYKTERNHTVDILFVITLFCVFAFSIILLTGAGANVYESIVESMTENNNSRTSFSYIINKVHGSDMEGRVSLGTYEGLESLVISEEIDNVVYCTYLYYYDGSVRELFTRSGQEFDPSFGTEILPADSFSVSYVTDGLLKFEITPAGCEKETLFVDVRSNK